MHLGFHLGTDADGVPPPAPATCVQEQQLNLRAVALHGPVDAATLEMAPGLFTQNLLPLSHACSALTHPFC